MDISEILVGPSEILWRVLRTLRGLLRSYGFWDLRVVFAISFGPDYCDFRGPIWDLRNYSGTSRRFLISQRVILKSQAVFRNIKDVSEISRGCFCDLIGDFWPIRYLREVSDISEGPSKNTGIIWHFRRSFLYVKMESEISGGFWSFGEGSEISGRLLIFRRGFMIFQWGFWGFGEVLENPKEHSEVSVRGYEISATFFWDP